MIYKEFLVDFVLARISFEVMATNNCGFSASSNLTLNPIQSSPHCFQIDFSFKTRISYDCEFIPAELFTRKVAEYLGFNFQQDLSLINYSKKDETGRMFSIKVAVTQSRVDCVPCDFVKVSLLTDKLLQRSNASIKNSFARFMLPMFEIAGVAARGIDACSPTPVTTTR